jgi:hypothetical protein
MAETRVPLTDPHAETIIGIGRDLERRFEAGSLTHDFDADARDEVARVLDHRRLQSFTSCGPWLAAYPNPSGKVLHAECMAHHGRSRTAVVNLRNERCGVARRRLPAAR